jgi:hypothetical protein
MTEVIKVEGNTKNIQLPSGFNKEKIAGMK